ncbi:DUF1642 domain-containing protein [Enterococcus faecium]|nr:DUF1642 domain-containing protein [Enterococcus faecium]
MNKQELIDKYTAEIAKLRPYCPNRNLISEQLKYDLYKEILDDLEQLDEPQKPVVPQFVVDWFEEHKRNLDYSIWEYIREWGQQDRFSDFHQWFDKEPNNPIETLIRMKDGYEVEKEPLYYVPLPDTDKDSEVVYALEKKRDGGIEISLVDRRKLGVSDSTKLSEQEIKSVDERYQLFAKEVAK